MIQQRIISIIIEAFFKILHAGLVYTIPLALCSFIIGLFIAIIVALVQVAHIPCLKQLSRFYVWVFRGTPLMVQLFIIFYGLPKIGIALNAIPAAILTFSLNTGAYASETIRGSILAVNKGQSEAAYSVGMNYFQTMIHVILPQALKACIPALFNTFISLVKDTSLAANITVVEMFMVTQQLVARTYEPLILYIEIAFVYLLFSTILTKLQNLLEKRNQIQRGHTYD